MLTRGSPLIRPSHLQSLSKGPFTRAMPSSAAAVPCSPPLTSAGGARVPPAAAAARPARGVAVRRRAELRLRLHSSKAVPGTTSACWALATGGPTSSEGPPLLPITAGALSMVAARKSGRSGRSRSAVCAMAMGSGGEASGADDEKKAKKAKKKAKKADKRQMKMEAETQQDEEEAERRDSFPEVSASSTILKTLDMHMEGMQQERSSWQRERESWERREATLLGMVDSLTARIADMSAASQQTPVAAGPEATAPKQKQPESSDERMLGGRGVQDIVDAIEEVNSRFRGNGANASTPQVPPSALDVAAALKSVELTDVLSDMGDLSMPRRKGREAKQSDASAEVEPEAEPAAAEAQPELEAEAEMVDVDKSTPATLKYGDDDIFWVNQLQASLLREGLYCGEEEMEEWYFGHHTQEALMTYQSMKGLPETGVCDLNNWEYLLGPGFKLVTKEEMPDAIQQAGEEQAPSAEEKASAEDLFAFLDAANEPKTDRKDDKPSATVAEKPSTAEDTSTAKSTTISRDKLEEFSTWPLLRMDDGNQAVHHLQVVLERVGFACDEDEMRWWMFGESTYMSLITFQACNGLPETGMTDESTWKKLIGDPQAEPADLTALMSLNSYDEDLSDMGSFDGGPSRIWLVGENRWSNPM